MGKVVGVAYDLREGKKVSEDQPPDYYAEFDQEITVDSVCHALSSAGHKVVKLGSSLNILKNIPCLKKIDIVFNICEGLGSRNRESQVPVILEMLGIPFVGSDALTLGLSLDKPLTKKLLMYENILTPRFKEIQNAQGICDDGLKYPLIVKPSHEGSSKGLSEKSIVNNFKELKKQTQWLIKTYKQPAIVEEFIEGMEFTVPIIGNNPPKALPIVQIKIDKKLNLGRLFYTFECLTSDALKYICPAKISKNLEKKMQDLAVRTYKAVECRDFGRVDFRVDKNGRSYVLEINPLPSLSLEDVFNLVPQYMGTTYDKIVNDILNAALQRYGVLK